MRPEDDFWSMKRYTQRFGSPHTAKNKRLGHRVSVLDGIKGVIVPCNNDGPTGKVRRVSGDRVERDEEEDSEWGKQMRHTF